MENVSTLFRGGRIDSCTNQLLVEACLHSLNGLSVWEQLNRQYISKIVLGDISASAYLWPRIEDGESGRTIQLSINRPSVWPFSIGHELGHTFFTGEPDYFNRICNRLWSIGSEREEDFCELFAWCWLMDRGNYIPVMDMLEAKWGYRLWPPRGPRETAPQYFFPML